MTPAPAADAILEIRAASWPPVETVALGGWLLRRGDGGGRRCSSVWPKGAPDQPLDAAIDAAEAQYRAWSATPYVQIGPADMALDARLAERGWRVEARSRLLAGHVAPLAAPGPDGWEVARFALPSEPLAALWAEGGTGSGHLRAMQRVSLPKTALLAREDGAPAAAAFIAAEGRLAQLHALYVAPRFRRRGLGAALVAAAAAFAAEVGAEWLTLAVEEENDGARSLYARLGFIDRGGYLYRRAPEIEG